MVDITKLPKAKSGFEELRSLNQIYVDHTDLIYEFAYLDGPNFLSRPRRFGKSLLVSTLESLFSHGTTFFKGLKIENLWEEREKGKTYKVIHLDFSSLTFSDKNEFNSDLCKRLKDIIITLNIKVREIFDDDNAGTILYKIVTDNPGQIVLLIDEYDYPLTHSLDDKSLFEDYRKYIQGLFGVIKSQTSKMRFIFITGVGRFAKTSVFSQLNNLRDLGLESKFAPLLGYTEDDMYHYFDEYVENAANILKLSKEECYAQIKSHYDGYRFHVNNDTLLHNPWSVLNFLASPEEGFKNFWYETGGAYPTLISKYIKSIQNTPLTQIQKVKIGDEELSAFYDFFDVPTVSLLYQTGYLTVRTEENDLGGESLFLVPPNLEVKSALTKLYYVKIRKNAVENNVIKDFSTAIVNNFETHNLERMIKTFSAALNTFGYDDNEAFNSEHYCRDIIYFTLTLSGLNAQREVISSNGRADLIVELPESRYVFEFKLAKEKNFEEKLLEEAIEQTKDKRYGEILPLKTLTRIAVVISANDKNVALWNVCE